MVISYLRNLGGQILGAAIIVSKAKNVPVENFGTAELLLVANTLWASAVPTGLRYFNKKDPAFGRVAESVAGLVSKKLEATAVEASKPKAKAKAKPAAKKSTK